MFNWETIENSLSLYTFVHIVERNQTDWTHFAIRGYLFRIYRSKNIINSKKGLFYEVYYVFINMSFEIIFSDFIFKLFAEILIAEIDDQNKHRNDFSG